MGERGGSHFPIAIAAHMTAAQQRIDTLRLVVLVLTFFAFELVAIGLTTPSPTATGGESLLRSADPAKGILRVTRHPFLWGVALWSLSVTSP